MNTEAAKTLGRLARLGPLMLTVAALNYLIDPGNVFTDGHRERAMAQGLHAGSTVAVSGLNDRLLQRFYAAGLKEPFDVLVLGSSRTMEVRHQMFPGRRTFNASVVAATLEDHVAIFGLHDAAGTAPKAIVLGVDPWLLNAKHGLTRWRNLSREYETACARLKITCSEAGGALRWSWWTTPSWWELVSPSYLQASLVTARERARNGIRPWNRDWVQPDTPAVAPTMFPDGSRRLAMLMARTPEEVRMLALRSGFSPGGGLASFHGIGANRADQLDSFARALQRRGIGVMVLLAPFHPRTWAQLVSSPRFGAIAGVEPYVRRWARKRGIAVTGSYDPVVAGCPESEFYDGSHSNEACLGRLLAAQRKDGAQ